MRYFFGLLMFGLVAPCLAGCVQAPATPAKGAAWAPAPRASLLAPGDRVRIAVAGEPELTGIFRIGVDGVLRLALVGGVRAAGLTPDMLAAQLHRRLAAGYLKNPQVVVARPAPPMGQGGRPLLAGTAAEPPSPPALRHSLDTGHAD